MTIESIFLLAVLALYFALQMLVLCGAVCAMYMTWCCIRVKRTLSLFIMDCDELIENLLAEPQEQRSTVTSEQHVSRKRARLAAVVSGGQKMMFKGQTVTPERIDSMEDAEIEELHARYEARLGAAMSKSLGSSLLRMYASVASMLLPLPPSRQPELVADLEQDPFLSSALQSACCELYYRYGVYLAPLTAALTTAKHCDWNHIEENDNTPSILTNANDNDGRSEGTGASADSANSCESERP